MTEPFFRVNTPEQNASTMLDEKVRRIEHQAAQCFENLNARLKSLETRFPLESSERGPRYRVIDDVGTGAFVVWDSTSPSNSDVCTCRNQKAAEAIVEMMNRAEDDGDILDLG